jgi:hypothetical protein
MVSQIEVLMLEPMEEVLDGVIFSALQMNRELSGQSRLRKRALKSTVTKEK